MAYRQHETGIWYRPGSYDVNIIEEVHTVYAIEKITKEDVCLDIGGCFGAFSFEAEKRGAKTIAVEPMPYNHDLFRINCPVTHLIPAAAVSRAQHDGLEQILMYYPAKTGNHGLASTTPSTRRTEVAVAVVYLEDLYEQYKPTFVKVDCEGAEFDLLRHVPLPPSCRILCAEIHMNQPAFKRDAAELVRIIEEQGFVATLEPDVSENARAWNGPARTTNAIWTRK